MYVYMYVYTGLYMNIMHSKHTHNFLSLTHTLILSDMQELLKLLSSVYSTPNIGGINNEELYSKCHVGTKVLVEVRV
jgi:hypothetical protein